MISIHKIMSHFKEEADYLFDLYKSKGKRPKYFPYNQKPKTAQQMVAFGLFQLGKAIASDPDIDPTEAQQLNLTDYQWAIYKWFTTSIKSDHTIILRKCKQL